MSVLYWVKSKGGSLRLYEVATEKVDPPLNSIAFHDLHSEFGVGCEEYVKGIGGQAECFYF